MLDSVILFFAKLRDFGAELIDRPSSALATTAGALGTAEVARTTHWATELAGHVAPYAALVGYGVTFMVGAWWLRKWAWYVVGVFLSLRDMSKKCVRCDKFSLKCAGCVRNALKPDGEE